MNVRSSIHQTSSSIEEIAARTPTVIEYSSDTSLEDFSCVNTWTVKGLKRLCVGTSIESAVLTHQNSSKWCMVLTKTSNELHLCFLLKKSETNKVLRAKLKADEILPNGAIREAFPCKWYKLKEGEKSETRVIRKTDTAGENYSENEIVLKCEVCIQYIIQDELPVANAAEPNASIVRDLDEMLHKAVHTDFELHAEGNVLKVHRALLSVRSPYFAAMLQPHTKEAKDGCVEVTDVKLEVLKQVLLFMYTGVAPALSSMSWDLLTAADTYQLRQLKRQCETHIASCLNVDNAAATALYASVFSCDLLWDRAILFIKRNLCNVMRTAGWAEAVAAHPEVIQRISEMME
ncbi:speckle-type POZ protein-like [Schistocerca cancellata]|uniref:speckle-type POZ protein-like n=1 Tax=Schistocerca cancellata TaxID=274614 RepID=UPI002118ECD4|nr:speckle-type POZ protein-like [Schistocerca cancellata]XP_049768954.1 speckle-type POZ protein-like [Schistocerca cancellata]